MPKTPLSPRRLLARNKDLLSSNIKAVLQLNGAQQGSTVFVVGSSPQLNSLGKAQIRELGRRPTIGVNRTQFVVNLRYFLSAYPHEVFLAKEHIRHVTAINMRPNLSSPLIPKTLAVRRVDHSLGDSLRAEFEPELPSLHTLRNVALGATHLALILGASRIVYVGVQQTNGLHYYDEIPELRELISQVLSSVPENLFAIDHHNATLDSLLSALRVPKEVLANQQFYDNSHQESFRDFFRAIKEHGVEPFATLSDSVVALAGARVVSIDEALSW